MARSRAGRIAAFILVGVVVVAAAGYALLRSFEIDAARDLVVQRLEAITGREVAIAGDFDLVPALAPTLAAEGLVIANARWASDAPMLEAERVEIQFQLVPLLWQGDLLVDRLSVAGAELLLERTADGQANWQFGTPAPASADPDRRAFLLAEVAMADSRLLWRGPEMAQPATAVVDRLAWQAPTVTSEVSLSAAGQWQEQPFELAGTLGPLADLLSGADAYPVALEGSLGPLAATVAGEVRLADDALDLEVRVAGDQLARLGELAAAELPALGAYEITGTLTGPLRAPALVDLSGTVGEAGAPTLRVADGRIDDLLAGAGIRAQLAAEGEQIADLAAALGLEMAPFGRTRRPAWSKAAWRGWRSERPT